MMDEEAREQAAKAYVVAALWSSTDDDGEPLDANYTADDILTCTDAGCDARQEHRWCRVSMARDVETFIDGCQAERPDVFDDMDPAQIGHDFWLTRNHHGAGFWDRGTGEVGDWLTKESHPYGDANLYVTDDGKLAYDG